MRKWVSLCSVSVEGSQGEGGALRRRGKEKRCTGAKHIPRLRSSNASLAGWDSERREGERGWGGGAHTVNIAMPSVSLQRDKQANCSILPLMLHSEQAVCTIITGRHVYSHYKVK